MSAVTAVVRPLPQPEPPKEVILTMPYAVAQSLRALTGFRDSEYRGLEDVVQICDALCEAGVAKDGAKTQAAIRFRHPR